MANILRVKRPQNPSVKWKPATTDLTAGEISVGYPTSTAPDVATDPIVLYYYDGANLRILGDKYFAQLPTANGIMVKKSDGTTSAVSIAAGQNIVVTNGDGINGNPTISLSNNIIVSSVTVTTGLVLNPSLTANRLLAINNGRQVISTDLADWITVGSNLTKSANDGAVTLDIVSTPTFYNVTLNNLTPGKVPYVNSSQTLVDSPISVGGSDIFVEGNIAINGTPTSDNHVVTKAYVDNLARGLKAKQSCKVATTGNVNLSNPGTNTFDGVTVSVGDRILVWQQTDPAENGIYVFNGSNSYMKRAGDADSWDELVSAFVFVEQGDTYGDKAFYCTVDQGGTLGTDPITWVQFANITIPDAGRGLYFQDGAYHVGAGRGIIVNSNSIEADIDTTKGLNFDRDGILYVAVNTSRGLDYDSTGKIQINDETFSKIHTQNTDLGTSNTSFYIGPSGDQILLVNNSGVLDIQHYNGEIVNYAAVSASALKLNTFTNSATVQFNGSANSTYTLDFTSGQTTYTLLTNYSVIDGGTY